MPVMTETKILGESCGKNWAEKFATKAELDRLKQFVSSDDIEVFFAQNDAYGESERLAQIIQGKDLDRSEMLEFWEFMDVVHHGKGKPDGPCSSVKFDERIHYTPEFARGFIEGAAKVIEG